MPSAIATAIASLILPVVFVSLRFLGRRVEHVSWWWDDYSILLSLLFLIASFWADIKIAVLSSPVDQSFFLWYIYITNVFHPLIVSTTKLSGLLLYLVHHGFKRRYAYPTYVLLALVSAWSVATFFATVFQCQPVSAAWAWPFPSASSDSARCLDQATILQATAVSSAILDLLTMIVTFPGAYSIDWIFGRGTLIFSCYLMGALTLTFSILSALYATQWISVSQFPGASYEAYFLWTKMHEGFGIVTVCLWPSAFGILAVATCSLAEPKGRVFAYFRKKTHTKLKSEGFGALLSDSEERRAMANICRYSLQPPMQIIPDEQISAEAGVPMGVKGKGGEIDAYELKDAHTGEYRRNREKLREQLDAEIEAKRGGRRQEAAESTSTVNTSLEDTPGYYTVI